MLTRFAYRLHAGLERVFPEKRLFLKSDTDTRFIRLRPATQALMVSGAALALGWMVFSTSVVVMDQISAGSGAAQSQRRQAMFEQRLNALSIDRDQRAEEAVRAQERFTLAMVQVAEMQTKLLASEDRRRELETGIDVIQNTLRRTIKERDVARADTGTLPVVLAEGASAPERSDASRAQDATATVDFLASALKDAAVQRDQLQGVADKANARADSVMAEKQALLTRNTEIFNKLEEALTVSVQPLEKMFRAAGLSPDDMIRQVRRGTSGSGGPVGRIVVSTKSAEASADADRANAILQNLDNVNLYRMAAFRAPFAMPVTSSFRWTSGFGGRNDPFGRGRRSHEGVDMAGAKGTPILATADGVVVDAGWASGYGRLIKIKHDFGIETRYGHLSAINVKVGQRVSRGDRIGGMGSTGRSTGTHLHYEIRIGGRAVNPMTFIKAANHVF